METAAEWVAAGTAFRGVPARCEAQCRITRQADRVLTRIAERREPLTDRGTGTTTNMAAALATDTEVA